MYQLKFAARALADLEGLDAQVYERVVRKLRFFATQENPLRFSSRLTNPKEGTYRFRVGDYRAVFDLDHNGAITILMILRVKHRREVYD
ncbi:MAG: type II toxin-antitoxin system RelE/ParE family toxin [Candidatus Magasanikbacteria bacterium]|nr:type II toxin-antitoxin system RelE/ParE family toxin [Candidatus Magasanikbacteria bacterium]